MTATAKQIDWTKPTKPVQANNCYCDQWLPVRVLCTDLSNQPYPVVFAIKGTANCEWTEQCSIDGTCGTTWQFRNTPAPPVPFDYTKYVNVYRYSDGTEDLGDMHDSLDKATASARRAVGVQVATVPVTICGEWREADNG